MFGKMFGKKAEAAVQNFSGRTDFLEAVRQMWPFEGYALCERLAAEATA